MVNGNTANIHESLLKRLDAVYGMRAGRDEFLPAALAGELIELSHSIKKEVAVSLGRDGTVLDVSVGDAAAVRFPQLQLLRRETRLSGVRCIHTHPMGTPDLSGIDVNTLKTSRLDAMCALGIAEDGAFTGLQAALITPDGTNIEIHNADSLLALPLSGLMRRIRETDAALMKANTPLFKAPGEERAVLIGLKQNGDAPDSLAELAELARTAGAAVLCAHTQARAQVDPAFYFGKGKVNELAHICSDLGATVCIADDELSGTQIRNLEEALDVKVVDRTALILDIFAARARSHEGRAQVELAQLKYRLPRLQGMGLRFSRQTGGIGTRGPGEKKLEIDRRRIRRRIHELEAQIALVKEQRHLRRGKREKTGVPTVAVVGYTNAGKSTLFNALSGGGATAEDKLFATLDPTTRRIALPSGRPALITDTVGFIDKLPHDLVEAFRSTLEEAVRAQLILHVVDASSPSCHAQRRVAEEVLRSLDARDTPVVTVYNKMDAVLDEKLPGENGRSVMISALHKKGLDQLLQRMEDVLFASERHYELTVPYGRADVEHHIHRHAQVRGKKYLAEGVRMQFTGSAQVFARALDILSRHNASEQTRRSAVRFDGLR